MGWGDTVVSCSSLHSSADGGVFGLGASLECAILWHVPHTFSCLPLTLSECARHFKQNANPHFEHALSRVSRLKPRAQLLHEDILESDPDEAGQGGAGAGQGRAGQGTGRTEEDRHCRGTR
jgi:hypothetical protein